MLCVYLCGGFEIIFAQLATERSVSTCAGSFEMIIAQLAIEQNVSLFHLFLPFLFPSSAIFISNL